MKRFAAYAIAFCTLSATVSAVGVSYAAAPTLGENFTQYTKTQVQWGATRLPVAAQLAYLAAVSEQEKGNTDKAVAHLKQALEYDPQYPDAYFTLSRIKFRRFDPDALYYAVSGIKAMLANFRAQSLLAVNSVLMAGIVLLMLSTIACAAFAIRYLPFLAHKIGEILSERFNAAAARFTAYVIILVPFALFPGFVSGVCLLILMTWYFMQRREKLTMIVLIVPFILLGFFAPRLHQFNALTNPKSFTYLAAKANNSAADANLIQAVNQARTPALAAENHISLGLLYLRQESFETAASHFLSAIEKQPDKAIGYINLGNVYYLQGKYEKALEGYRKAEQIDDDDPVGQYNLAQAYIKTLLMAESSKALKNASAGGIEGVKESFAVMARDGVMVYPKTFSGSELWRIARVEGQTAPRQFLDEMLRPLTRLPSRVSAWFFLGAFLVAMILSRVFRERHLSFQCSNCGEITCDGCCKDNGTMFLCPTCAGVIEGVSSDKVIEALLRQRRQSVIVRRRKAIRMMTVWIPGIRDVFYGRMTRGVFLAAVFSFSIIQLWSRGYIVEDWNLLALPTPLWKWIAPAAGILITYAMSAFSRRYLEVRNLRSRSVRLRKKETGDEQTPRKASA